MTEVIQDARFERTVNPKATQLGVLAMQTARQLTGEALGKNSDEVTIAEIAQQYAKGGFNEWEPEVAKSVRDVIAETYGFDHL